MDEITTSLLLLNIKYTKKQINCAIKIQKWFRGCFFRLKRLPLIMYIIQDYLKKKNVEFSKENDDGRINSSIDEDKVIKLLIEKFGEKKIKKKPTRSWCDILVYDNLYRWLPVNIKTTTTQNNSNVGNLSIVVYAYTNEKLDLDKKYDNGAMSDILFKKIKNEEYNTDYKKDYYFIVLNKNDQCDIIINSIKGLTLLRPNLNNLPFQVYWDKNREFKYENIKKKIKQFVDCVQKPKPIWLETFLENMRTLDL